MNRSSASISRFVIAIFFLTTSVSLPGGISFALEESAPSGIVDEIWLRTQVERNELDPHEVREMLSPFEVPFSGTARALPPEMMEDQHNLTILHHNDTHSQQLREKDFQNLGGYARIQTHFDEVRAEEGNLMIVHGGDFWEGTIFYNIGAGEADIEVMNTMGYDAVVLGNHDWLSGPEYLCDLLDATPPDFSILSANLYYDPDDPPLNEYIDEWAVYTFDDFKVGVFGLSPYELIYDTFMEPIDIQWPPPQARRMVTVLQDLGCDVIIALTHLGLAMDLTLPFLAPGIDIIIGGHSHDFINPPLVYEVPEHGYTYICQAGDLGKFIGRWDLTVSPDGDGLEETSYEMTQIDDSLVEDPDVALMIQDTVTEIEEKYGPIFDDEVGYTEVPLSNDGKEAYLPNLAADAFQAMLGTDLAITSSNTFSGPIYEGTFNTVDIYDAMSHVYKPLEDVNWQVHIFTMWGFQIQLMMDLIFRLDLFDFNVSGGEIIYDPDSFLAPTISIEIGGEPLTLMRQYYIAANEDVLESLYFVEDFLFLKLYGNVSNTGMEGWRVLKDYMLIWYGGYFTYEHVTAEEKGRIRTIHPDLRIRPEDVEFFPLGDDRVRIGARIRNIGEGKSMDTYRVDFHADRTPGDFTDDPRYYLLGSVTPGEKIYSGSYRDCWINCDISGLESGTYPITVTVSGDTKEREMGNNTAVDYFVID